MRIRIDKGKYIVSIGNVSNYIISSDGTTIIVFRRVGKTKLYDLRKYKVTIINGDKIIVLKKVKEQLLEGEEAK